MTNEEAFEKWFENTVLNDNIHDVAQWAWQAAIAYMQEQGEPYGYVWFDKNMEKRICSVWPPVAGEKALDEPIKVYTHPKKLKRLGGKKIEEMIFVYTAFNVNVQEDATTVTLIKNFAKALMDEIERINK